MNAHQNDVNGDDLRALALQLAVFTDQLEQRGAEVIQQAHQAAQHLARTATTAANTAERISAAALEQFRQVAAGAVADGLRVPIDEAEHTMQCGIRNIHVATNELDARVRLVGKLLTVNAWKAFVASALASAAVIAVAVYLSMSAHRDLARSEWTGLINAAIANGKLAPCQDGGLCARDGKKWVRIDQ